MRVIVLILTVVFLLTASAVGFFVLLLGLNGYSEKQAMPSLILYFALCLASALGLGGVSPFVTKRLVEKTSLGSFGASAIVVSTFSIIGVVILIGGLFASFVLAEIVRGMR